VLQKHLIINLNYRKKIERRKASAYSPLHPIYI
jgi:hypothetical protein